MTHFMHLWYDDWWTPKKGDYPLPCQSIESLTYDYTETKGNSHHKPSRFMVLVHFPNLKYRQIAHVQEYDIESLVGNIGGYIGLFLEYSLMNFPRFVMTLLGIIRKKLVPSVQKISRTNTLKRNNTLSPQHQRSNGIVNSELTVDSNQGHLNLQKNTPDTYLKSTRSQPITFLRRIDEVESQTIGGSEYNHYDKSISPESSIRKVRVTGWSNSLQTPHYI